MNTFDLVAKIIIIAFFSIASIIIAYKAGYDSGYHKYLLDEECK